MKSICVNSNGIFQRSEVIHARFMEKLLVTAQCDSFMIFLSLRFYVKSILEVLNCDLYELLQFLKGWNLPNWHNSEPLKWQKRKFHNFYLDSPKDLSNKDMYIFINWVKLNFIIFKKDCLDSKHNSLQYYAKNNLLLFIWISKIFIF